MVYEQIIHGIYAWLSKYQVNEKGYDYGGIYDPVDKRVLGEQYSATHFALLSALLFRNTNDFTYLKSAKLAIEFHIRTSKDEYRFGDGGYPWDFNNYAFLETHRLLNEVLSLEERKTWKKSIKSMKTNRYLVTNWFAMRAYSYLLRYKLFGSIIDYLKYKENLFFVNWAQLKDGCFEDLKWRSAPIQYHAFTLTILHRIYQITKDKTLKERFLRGVNYLKYFIDPDGDFNFKGRGQEQIFGYGAAIYVFEAAKKIDPANQEEYQYLLNKVCEYLLRFVNEEGHFPLVLNAHNDSEKMGWYDYHHLTVYNAFLGAWLALSSMISKSDVEAKKKNYDGITFFQPSQTLIVRFPSYYAVFSGGGTVYLSDCGLVPHNLWVKDCGWFSPTPGGPSQNLFGKINKVEHVEKNFFAPLAKDSDGRWIIPALKKGTITKLEDKIYKISLNYGPYIVEREVCFGTKEIAFEDQIHFKKDKTYQEFRYFNMPVSTEKYTVDVYDNHAEFKYHDEIKIILRLDLIAHYGDLECLEKIKTSRGYARILCIRAMEEEFDKKECKIIKYSLKFVGPRSHNFPI